MFFAFDPIPSINASDYAIVLEFTGTQDGSNRIDYGIDFSTPTDPGNIFFASVFGGPYTSETSQDLIYSVTGSLLSDGPSIRSIGNDSEFKVERISDTETKFTKLHLDPTGLVTASILMIS